MPRFNLLLRDAGLDPAEVSVILHSTTLPVLRRWLPFIAAERPDLFAAYQSVHSTTAEAILRRRPRVASFVPLPHRRMAFAGLYRIAATEERATAEIYADPRFAELEQVYGASDTSPERNIARAARQWVFRMELCETLAALRGRLVIAAPPGRTYVRIAANLDPEVVALTETSLLVPAPPDWDAFIVGGQELRGLPAAWAARLREWRGIYLIVDESDGARYVGAAYGTENLLGRWRAHVARDQGVTAELRHRDPARFRFSILELLAPAAPPDEVIARESGWKQRLHTLEHGLNRQ